MGAGGFQRIYHVLCCRVARCSRCEGTATETARRGIEGLNPVFIPGSKNVGDGRAVGVVKMKRQPGGWDNRQDLVQQFSDIRRYGFPQSFPKRQLVDAQFE
jgi:hypothetical protein